VRTQSLDARPHIREDLVEPGSGICARTILLECCSLKMRLPSFCSNMLGSTQTSVASTVCVSVAFTRHPVSIAVFTSTALAQQHLSSNREWCSNSSCYSEVSHQVVDIQLVLQMHILHSLQLFVYDGNFVALQSPSHCTHMLLHLSY